MKKCLSLAVGLLLMIGCATTPKIDWESRVGNFTFDQAVVELGPPDKNAQLTDGTRVAEWLTYRSRSSGGYVTYVGRGGLAHVMNDSSPDYFLRLTFDANGKLQGWKKYAK